MRNLIILLYLLGIFTLNQTILAQAQFINKGSQITLGSFGYLVVKGNVINKSTSQNAFHIEGTLDLSGNWQDSTTNASVQWGNSGKVILSGNSVQRIGGAKPNTFYNLEINNGGGVILDTNIFINNILILNNGVIYSSTTKTVHMQSGSSVSGGSDNSFVDGPMKKTGSSDFVFPIGDKGHIQQLGISNLQSNETFTAEYVRETPPQNTNFTSNLERVSSVEYWHLTPASGSPTINMSLYWNNGDSSGVTNPQTLMIAHQKSTGQWEGIPITNYMGNASAGNITGLVDSYSLYSLGSSSSTDNPLPIELISFEAKKGDGFYVNLHWITASEQNNDFFTVERSRHGKVWEKVGVVKGAGNSNSILRYTLTDENPYAGISYYRLKQTDFDGSFSYSEIRMINLKISQIQIAVYPNPTKDYIYVKNAYSQTEYFISNMLGAIVARGTFNNNTILDLRQLAEGVYTLHLHDQANSGQTDKVLKIVRN